MMSKNNDMLKGSLYDLMTMEIPPVKYHIPNILAEEQHNIYTGDSGSGKSTFMLYCGICIAKGIDTVFGKTRQGNVLFIDEEMGIKGLGRKVQQLSEPLGVKPNKLHPNFLYTCSQGFKFDSEHIEDVLMHYKTKYDIKVVFVDSLLATSEGDPNTMEIRKLRDFLRFGYKNEISINFTHHTNKQGTGKATINSKSMYGSIDITNSFDNTYGITPFKGKIKLEHIKSRFTAPEDRISLNVPFHEMKYDSPYPTASYKYIESIRSVFEISGETQLRFKDFKTALVDTGEMSKPTLIKYLRQCETYNKLRKSDGEIYEIQ
jgi:RecA-family ATPase